MSITVLTLFWPRFQLCQRNIQSVLASKAKYWQNGKLEAWPADFTVCATEMPVFLHWCICSTISDLRTSEEVFQFRRCILWKDEREKKNKIKKRNIKLIHTESLQNQKLQSICCKQVPLVGIFTLTPACSVALQSKRQDSHGNSFQVANA